MGRAFKPDKRGLDRMQRELQRELDKRPVRVPVEFDEGASPLTKGAPALGATIYNGPVFFGNADGAQLAWNNQSAHQVRQRVEKVTPGYEAIAQVVTEVVAGLSQLNLPVEDRREVEDVANEALVQVVASVPDDQALRRARILLKSVLIAAAQARSDDAWAKNALDKLERQW